MAGFSERGWLCRGTSSDPRRVTIRDENHQVSASCAALLCGLAAAQPQVSVRERQSFPAEELGTPEGAAYRLNLIVVILEGSGRPRSSG